MTLEQDIRVLVKPPTGNDPRWVVNVQRQPFPRASWQGFAQAAGDSLAGALRATADLIEPREDSP